jgi:hypothetical protein
MFGPAGRRFLSLHSSRRLTALVAAIVVLGAVCLSSAQPPTASAQGWPWWGNTTWGNNWNGGNWWGANNWWGNTLGYNGYGLGYGNPLNNVYGYGLNSYGYNLYGGGYLPGVVYATTSGAVPYQPSVSTDIYQPLVSVVGAGGYQIAPATIGYGVPHTFASVGEYCRDKTGGMVWVPAGSPTDGLTC